MYAPTGVLSKGYDDFAGRRGRRPSTYSIHFHRVASIIFSLTLTVFSFLFPVLFKKRQAYIFSY